MKKVFRSVILLLLGLLVSCSSQPKFIQAAVEPELATAGESIALQVQFTGRHEEIKDVYLTVREYPNDYPMIKLTPDTNDDENIWKRDIVVPYDAYSGEFHLDINAFVHSGKEIISEGFENNSTGKAGTIVLKIK